MGNNITLEEAQSTYDLVLAEGVVGAARHLGKHHSWVQRRLQAAERFGIAGSNRAVMGMAKFDLPKHGEIKRYIFTCAQNNTEIDWRWHRLMILAKYYDAQVCVSRFTYDKASFGERSVKPGAKKVSDNEDIWYAEEVAPHVLDASVQVAPGLIWCGEMNILPTAVNPLSGLQSYTGRKSGIFPHTKVAMESVASGKNEATKFNYTTGAVTERNYIAKKEGQKAKFHHTFGGLLVEVNSDGEWWCRQISAAEDGSICDLDVDIDANGKLTDGMYGTEAIVWGDIHVGTVSDQHHDMLWGYGGMFEALSPKYQVMHDVLDFHSQNYHDRNDHHKMFARHKAGKDNVVREICEVASFLSMVSNRNGCHTVVVDSNHHDFLIEWLRNADYRKDPQNAIFFLEAQLAMYKAIAAGEYLGYDKHSTFNPMEWAIRHSMPKSLGAASITFLKPDESFVLGDGSNGIECGMHGHHGINGARGSMVSLAKMGRKSIIGHVHSAGIYEGVYAAGVTGSLDQGYNVGPSSWSNSHVVVYRNGKRAIVTTWNNKWRA